MDSKAKNRVRLWLRSEKQFGLPAVKVLEPLAVQVVAPHPAQIAPAETRFAVARPSNPPASPAPRRREVAEIFEKADPFAGTDLTPPMFDEAPFDSPVLSSDEKKARLIALDTNEVRGCTKCRLCETRTQTVFGEGTHDARIMFIGEGPGESEDLSGQPFVGRAGQQLNKWINAMGLSREQVYIANIVKCRPPDNRVPAPDEVATCTPYLQRQIEIIRPSVIITLGLPSSKYMLQSKLPMGRLRGQWFTWRGIKLMPTYHPAFILRQSSVENRAAVWSDLQKVMLELKLPIPQKK